MVCGKIGEPASEASLLDKLQHETWRNSVAVDGGGFSLTEFAEAMGRALEAYGCGAKWSIEITPVIDAALTRSMICAPP